MRDKRPLPVGHGAADVRLQNNSQKADGCISCNTASRDVLRRYTIGTHGVLNAREARNIAKNLLHKVVLGHDPADKKKNNKRDQADGKIQNSSHHRKQQVVEPKASNIYVNPRKSAAKVNKASPVSPEPVVNKTKSISSPEKPEIPGYLLEEVIFESSRIWLWRGKRQRDGALGSDQGIGIFRAECAGAGGNAA